jgi:hypothetical protein
MSEVSVRKLPSGVTGQFQFLSPGSAWPISHPSSIPAGVFFFLESATPGLPAGRTARFDAVSLDRKKRPLTVYADVRVLVPPSIAAIDRVKGVMGVFEHVTHCTDPHNV